ncbi:hypothetical protein BDQ17DRAFT_1546049 [Cyathus striatus]|nr:hypothetical protein BDQ17DRAFT_1546049 [Cyathus striatus]
MNEVLACYIFSAYSNACCTNLLSAGVFPFQFYWKPAMDESESFIAVISEFSTSLLASRYFTAAGLTIILWDHLTTLDKEVELLWNSNGRYKWLLKGAFIFNRHVHEIFLLFVVYASSGIQIPSINVCLFLPLIHDLRIPKDVSQLCRSFMMAVTFFGTAASVTAQFLIILQVYILMERRRTALVWLTSGFIILSSITHAFVILSMIEIKDASILVAPGLNTCVLAGKVRFFLGMLVPICTFDFFIVALTIYNALERPYQSNAELINSFYKDGAKLFLGNIVFHVIDLLMVIFGSPDKVFILLFFFCALSSVLLARLCFKLENFSNVKLDGLLIYSFKTQTTL